ncbi:hypothetical protein LCGC14_1612590 [marine sediment metagenome]|uniref:Uncharacterized protein n=1 Tax=marine sediment metagenome TaxID=412755 RepID=A0A0F9I7T5_9ZZZZ
METEMTVRERVWFEAWETVASAVNCFEQEAATGWADHCLAMFDLKFPHHLEGMQDIQ